MFLSEVSKSLKNKFEIRALHFNHTSCDKFCDLMPKTYFCKL